MLTLTLITKLVCEIAWLCLLGRGVLGLLAGERRHNNIFYGVLHAASQPWVKGVARLAPRGVPERHHAWLAFGLVSALWVVATFSKISMCIEWGVAHCR